MTDETSILIGGKEYPVKLYYYKVFKILEKYNRMFSIRRRTVERKTGRDYDPTVDKIFMSDKFFFWCVFFLLDKRGFLFFKKPFRSVGHLSKNILRDEAVSIVRFIGDNILYTRTDAEPEKTTQKKN